MFYICSHKILHYVEKVKSLNLRKNIYLYINRNFRNSLMKSEAFSFPSYEDLKKEDYNQ